MYVVNFTIVLSGRGRPDSHTLINLQKAMRSVFSKIGYVIEVDCMDCHSKEDNKPIEEE